MPAQRESRLTPIGCLAAKRWTRTGNALSARQLKSTNRAPCLRRLRFGADCSRLVASLVAGEAFTALTFSGHGFGFTCGLGLGLFRPVARRLVLGHCVCLRLGLAIGFPFGFGLGAHFSHEVSRSQSCSRFGSPFSIRSGQGVNLGLVLSLGVGLGVGFNVGLSVVFGVGVGV
ncbi:unnamed protein product, partial [Protopolystoma xenopodis]